jgi:hypothetical protein
MLLDLAEHLAQSLGEYSIREGRRDVRTSSISRGRALITGFTPVTWIGLPASIIWWNTARSVFSMRPFRAFASARNASRNP